MNMTRISWRWSYLDQVPIISWLVIKHGCRAVSYLKTIRLYNQLTEQANRRQRDQCSQ